MIRNIVSRRAGLVLVALAGTALFTGCGIFNPKKDDGPPPPVTHDRTTPARLIDFFAWQQADPQRNIEEYTRCLHPNYQFYFTDADRKGDPTLPLFFTKEDDVNSTQGMFNTAVSITANIVPEGASSSAACDPGDPEGPQCLLQPVRVTMAVQVPDPPDLTLLVNGIADFYIVKDPVDTTLYVIYQIYDKTNQLGRYGAPPIAPLLSEGSGSPMLPAEVPTERLSWGAVHKRFAGPGF